MSNDYIIGRAIPLQTRNGNQGSFGEGAAALNPARNYSVFEFLRIENILTADTARGALPVYDDSLFGDDGGAGYPTRYKGSTSDMLWENSERPAGQAGHPTRTLTMRRRDDLRDDP